MKIEYALATHNDDRALQKLIASNPVPGNIAMTYTREPSFFDSVAVMGKSSDVFIARKSGQILAMGMASYIDGYVNGKAKEIGYLSSLRIDRQLRNSRCFFQGYDFLKKLDAEKNIPFYLSTIIEDNYAARKMLSINRMSIPQYIDIGKYITYAILLRKGKKYQTSGHGIKNVRSIDELDLVVAFLNREGAKKQYYPVYTRDELIRFKGFDYRNLWLCHDRNEILGVVGVWDQLPFKQTKVHEYNGVWKLAKPFYNMLSYPLGYKKLPECGEKFEYFFLSFVAVKDNQPRIFSSILNHIYRLYANTKYHYMIIGLHENDPLNQAIENFKAIRYNARLYVVSYKPVDMQALNRITVPYLESARL